MLRHFVHETNKTRFVCLFLVLAVTTSGAADPDPKPSASSLMEERRDPQLVLFAGVGLHRALAEFIKARRGADGAEAKGSQLHRRPSDWSTLHGEGCRVCVRR